MRIKVRTPRTQHITNAKSLQMHPNEIQALRAHVVGALKQCTVTDNWPDFDSYSTHVRALADRVVNRQSHWLTASDVFRIFIAHVDKALRKDVAEREPGLTLTTVLGPATIDNIADQLLEFLSGTPRHYLVSLPIPELPFDEDALKISDSLQLSRTKPRGPRSGNLRGTGLLGALSDGYEPQGCSLVVKVEGFFGNSLETSAARASLSTFKVFLQQALATGLLRRKTGLRVGMLAIGADYLAHTVPKHRFTATDQSEGALPASQLELSLDICKFLDEHEFAPIASNNNGQQDPVDLNGFAATLLPAALLTSSKNEAVTRIRTAAEWAFDAYLTENPVLALIQTSIGFEAIYGDENDGENVTRTLADRCAYLICKSIKERKVVKEKFRKFYSARSKVVHGVVNTLNDDDEQSLHWGRLALQASIVREIAHLALDKD